MDKITSYDPKQFFYKEMLPRKKGKKDGIHRKLNFCLLIPTSLGKTFPIDGDCDGDGARDYCDDDDGVRDCDDDGDVHDYDVHDDDGDSCDVRGDCGGDVHQPRSHPCHSRILLVDSSILIPIPTQFLQIDAERGDEQEKQISHFHHRLSFGALIGEKMDEKKDEKR